MAISGVASTTHTVIDPTTGVEQVVVDQPAQPPVPDVQPLMPAVDQVMKTVATDPPPAPPATTDGTAAPVTNVGTQSAAPANPQATDVPPPAGKPPGYYVDAAKYGVVGDGVTDNTAALQHALRDAKAVGQTLYLGAGTYAHSGALDLNGTKINGDGDSTVLKSTNPVSTGVTLSGEHPALTNVAVDGGTSTAPAVLVQGATKATIDHVTTQGSAADPIQVVSSTDTILSNINAVPA
jgi:hypothetical protein